jgi:hypothetical protein
VAEPETPSWGIEPVPDRLRVLGFRPEARPEMILAWLAGFCLYQWLSPRGPGWWTSAVAHTHPHSSPWRGASLPSFAAAFALAVLARALVRDRAPRESLA